MSRISIVMCTYNGSKYISDQLKTVANQTRAPYELIISDDGSTDDTRHILLDFSKSAPFPVRLRFNVNKLGYRHNFITAAQMAKGNTIAFCDQDDLWRRDKLEVSARLLEESGALLVHHNATLFSDDEENLGDLSQVAASAQINQPLACSPWLYGPGFTQVFRRHLLAYTQFWPRSIDEHSGNERMAHDQWFFFLASAIGSIGYISAPLVRYRQHPQNSCGWHQRDFRQRLKNFVTSNDEMRCRSHAQASYARAHILRAIAEFESGKEAMALRAAEKYMQIASSYEWRADLYGADGFANRAHIFSRLLCFMAYSPSDPWKLSLPCMVKDGLIRTPLGNLIN